MMKLSAFFLFICFSVSISNAQNAEEMNFPSRFDKNNCLPNTIIVKFKAQQSVSETDKSAIPQLFTTAQLAKYPIRFKSQKQLFQPETHSIFQNKSIKKVGKNTKELSLIYQMEVDSSLSIENAIQLLKKMDNIEYACPVYTNYQSLYVPNDPLAQPAQQYHLTKIKAFEAWDVQKGNANMIIGIVDNAFTLTNADLSTQAIAPTGLNRDIANNDNTVNVSGGEIHGTIVALCASARPDNSFAGVGTGFNCRFLPIKVATDANVNAYIRGYEGIILAAQQTGVGVINLSWGRKGTPNFFINGASAFEYDILETVVADYDVVLVAAAGNDNTTDFFYPASYNDLVLSVAATESNDFKASFSTYNAKVDVTAPGQAIIVGAFQFGASENSGTSFASPLVAGTAALLRVQYPTLSASQIIARIKTTTDYIDAINENANYKGKLGTGRLNMQKALSATFKAISLESYSFTNAERGFLFRGKSGNMICQFKNHLDALANFQINVTTDSPYLTITDNQSNLGAINSNTIFNNSVDVFTIQVANNAPVNTVAVLKFQYQDGSYTYTEEKRILLNPGHIDINEMLFAVGEAGRLAIYDNTFTELAGVNYLATDLLKEAGLMIGVNTSSNPSIANIKVSDAVRSSNTTTENNFTVETPFSQRLSTDGKFLETNAVFEDITNNSNRINLEITQKTYTWNEANLTKGTVVEYQVKNVSDILLENMHVGLFADWNIDIITENRAGWDNAQKLGYVYAPAFGDLWGGIQLLTDKDTANYYAFDNATTNNPIRITDADGFTELDKYNAISKKIQRTAAGASGLGADVSHAIAASLRTLDIGEAKTVTFAFVVGDNLTDLKANATAIKNKYISIKTSPTPVLSNQQVCKGNSVVLNPNNGSRFNFYTVPPTEPNALVIQTGNTLNISNIFEDQTIYITCVDSVFESQALAVQITVVPLEADFTISAEELNLAQSNQIDLTNTAINAAQFAWSITKSSETANANVTFLNGTNATSPNPKVQFNSTGNYQIKLIATSSQSCKDSLIQSFQVYRDITTGISQFLKENVQVFPNPNKGYFQVKIPELNGIINLTLLDNLGKVVYRTQNQNNPETPFNLNVSNLANGIYTLKIQEEKGFFYTKIIVQR